MSDADVAQHQPENEEEEEILQSKPLADQITSLVQRQEEPPEEEEEETLQPKPLADQITPLVQRQEEPPEEEEELQAKSKTGETPAVNPSIESRINSFKGGGQALPRDTRTFFESRMGRDFGGVRIHTDNKAADTAQSVRAKAFTLGNNIVFDTSQYSPNNQKGKKLLAHELTHVVQQAGGMSSAGSGNGRSIVMSASSALTLMRDKKAKIPVSPLKCEPEPKTLDEVSKIVGSTDTMGYTKAAPIHLELEIKSEEGKCKLTITAEPRLSFKHLVYTKAGDYKMGTVTIPFKPCKGKVGDLYFRITPKMADKIKQGEIEHCRDNKLAFALSYERYVKAVKKVAAMDFSGKDVSSCQTEVLKHLKAETSIDVSNWKSVADCLFDKTLERDNKKWHAIKIMSGGGIDASKVSKFILDPSCGSLTLELDHTKLLNEVGKHPPKDVVKGCGEKWGKEVEKKIYVSGEMSDRYWQTTPKERSNINEEIDRRFIEETGVTHALDWEDPKDRPLARQWLRIRDEVMGEREASRTATR
ncbi:MAG: DUF4157 domain-containing protein [Planctomycetes bacterium]|nr:DUF4157 domain-containing protein [Planctomycetota bacterium]